MPLKTLAGLSGLSAGYISMVENGKRTIDRMSHLAAIAGALQVSVRDLQAYPETPVSPEHSAALAQIPAIRAAMAEITLGTDRTPSCSLDQLRAELNMVKEWRAACDYGAVGRTLPGLLLELEAYRSTAPDRVLPMLVEAWDVARSTLKYLGFIDLGVNAAEHAHRAALELGDPLWLGVAEFSLIHSLPPETRHHARVTSIRAADRLTPHLNDRSAQQVYGMLHLTAAWTYALETNADRAQEHLDEATQIAQQCGEDPHGGFGAMWFGPTNVEFWRAALAVEMGEGGRVREIARRIRPEAVRSASRQTAFYIDLGRGLAAERRDSEAVAALSRAEQISPLRVRTSPAVRETVAALLRRDRQRQATRPLRRLAEAVGVF